MVWSTSKGQYVEMHHMGSDPPVNVEQQYEVEGRKEATVLSQG